MGINQAEINCLTFLYLQRKAYCPEGKSLKIRAKCERFAAVFWCLPVNTDGILKQSNFAKVIFSITNNRTDKSFNMDGGAPYMGGKRIGILSQQRSFSLCQSTSPAYVDALGRVVGNECLDISKLM